MGKFHYRLPPCPHYDIESMESWLSEMAEKGFFLDSGGYVFGFFQFQKDAPRKAKYRLEPIADKYTVYVQATAEPDQEAIALNQEFGWEYLGQYKEFYIYRSLEPDARELNTDPVVYAMALDPVKKRNLFYLLLLIIQTAHFVLGFLGNPNSLRYTMDPDALERFTRLSLVFVCVPVGVILFSKPKEGEKRSEAPLRIALLVFLAYIHTVSYLTADAATPLLDILKMGWLWWSLFTACLVIFILASLISYLHICKLQRRLMRGEPLNREKNWKKRRFLRMLPAALPFLLLFALSLVPSYGGRSVDAIPIADFTQDVPFPTMSDLAPEREYIPAPKNGGNTVRFWQDILSPVNYDWNESAYLDAEDGSRYAGSLHVTYHEAASEDIAKRLIREYSVRTDWDPTLIPDSIDSSGFDFLAVSKIYHYTMLLRKDNIVIYAYCSVQSWGDHESLFPVWLEQMTARLS